MPGKHPRDDFRSAGEDRECVIWTELPLLVERPKDLERRQATDPAHREAERARLREYRRLRARLAGTTEALKRELEEILCFGESFEAGVTFRVGLGAAELKELEQQVAM